MNTVSLKTIKQNFVKELQDANAGKKTSLPFIVHKLSSQPIVKDGELFEVLVIGGTILKRAFCKKIKDKIAIIKKETERPIDFRIEREFLTFIDRELVRDVNVLALNFAYPLTPVFERGKLDGILMAVTKEGGFHGLVGKKVGEEIEKYILKKRNKRIKAAVANDTVCLLTSGLSRYKQEELGAAVVGTGFNIAFFLDKNRLVNLESANFDKFPLSKEARLIDKESSVPGKALFEKEISGAYLYKHFNLIIKERKIDFAQISSTEELSALSQDDRIEISKIAKNLLRRSAELVACQVAGIVGFQKSRHSGDQAKPETPESLYTVLHSVSEKRFWTSQNDNSFVFNMEGSLFWKGNNYKETVEKTARQLVPKYNVKFVEIKDSAIVGAAKLVG